MPPMVKKQVSPKARINGSPPSRPTGNVLARIAPIIFGPEEGIKMLLYGRSGTGKTTLWATFPKPILAVIASGGNKPGELRSINTPEYRDVISSVTLEHSSEMREIINYLNTAEKGRADFNTVVLDHASGLQDLILKEILGIDKIPEQKSWGMATQQQYGQCATQTKEILRELLNLDANVVIVAQEREMKGEGDSDLILPTVGAGMMPSIVSWLNPAVDYIGQTLIRPMERTETTTIGAGKQAKEIHTTVRVKGQVEYCLRSGPDPVYTTKFRVPRGKELPNMIVDPSYEKIAALIAGE